MHLIFKGKVWFAKRKVWFAKGTFGSPKLKIKGKVWFANWKVWFANGKKMAYICDFGCITHHKSDTALI